MGATAASKARPLLYKTTVKGPPRVRGVETRICRVKGERAG